MLESSSTKIPRFVNPDGSLIIQTKKIGALMGNRGKLGPILLQHPQPHASKTPWITCLLKKNGVALQKTSVSYTKLFFLDELTAFAAGHRPCWQCQPERYNLFLHFWGKFIDKNTTGFDTTLHQDRCNKNGFKKTFESSLEDLPSGVIVRKSDSEHPHLLLWGRLFPWTVEGYAQPVDASTCSRVLVLTPSLIVQMLKKGFPLLVNCDDTVHPSILKSL